MRSPSVASALALIFVLTSCSAPIPNPTPVSAGPTPAESTPAESSPSSVDWENYSPSYQQIIDEEAAEKDCDALQEMFDVADDADDAQRDRTGDGNADLMNYIDEAMRTAGCY